MGERIKYEPEDDDLKHFVDSANDEPDLNPTPTTEDFLAAHVESLTAELTSARAENKTLRELVIFRSHDSTGLETFSVVFLRDGPWRYRENAEAALDAALKANGGGA